MHDRRAFLRTAVAGSSFPTGGGWIYASTHLAGASCPTSTSTRWIGTAATCAGSPTSNLHDPGGRGFALYLVNVDGSGLERVTWTDSFASFPMFSRDGTRLIFSATRHAQSPRDGVRL